MYAGYYEDFACCAAPSTLDRFLQRQTSFSSREVRLLTLFTILFYQSTTNSLYEVEPIEEFTTLAEVVEPEIVELNAVEPEVDIEQAEVIECVEPVTDDVDIVCGPFQSRARG